MATVDPQGFPEPFDLMGRSSAQGYCCFITGNGPVTSIQSLEAQEADQLIWFHGDSITAAGFNIQTST